MALLQFCKTPRAIIMVGLRQETGPMLFATESYVVPGLYFKPEVRHQLNDEIAGKITEFFGRELKNLDITQEFSEEVVLQDESRATLYLATADGHVSISKDSLFPLPTLLRKMPKNRNRLSYLKAWQVMTGSLTLDTKAVELTDKELENHTSQSPEITH